MLTFNFCLNNKMINVFKSPRLENWFSVFFNGKLIDSTKSHAKAMEIAKKISIKYNSPIISSK